VEKQAALLSRHAPAPIHLFTFFRTFIFHHTGFFSRRADNKKHTPPIPIIHLRFKVVDRLLFIIPLRRVYRRKQHFGSNLKMEIRLKKGRGTIAG
jgi:hypothetical protein